MVVKFLSLNLRHGGGTRAEGLVEWLLSQLPSAVVLSEWRNNNSGQYIRALLTRSGLMAAIATYERSTKNSILLAATGYTNALKITPSGAAVGDLLMMELTGGIELLGCYFPQKQAKAPFFRRCIQAAQECSEVPLVIMGDLNTGRNDLDVEGTGTRFHCADLFAALTEEAGLIDLWREQHGEKREWTWRSRSNGFRIDHVFANKAFVNRFPTFRCTTDHTPRLSGLTDHSAMILEVK